MNAALENSTTLSRLRVTGVPVRSLPCRGVLFRLAACGAILAGFPADGAVAADWTLVPKISVTALYDDNLRLLPDDVADSGAAGANLDAALSFEYITPVSFVRLIPRVRANAYDDDQFDFVDRYLRLEGFRRGERSEMGVSAQYDLQRIFTTSLPGPDADDFVGDTPDLTDTTQAAGDADRTRFRALPRIEYELSQVWRVAIEGELLVVDYDSVGNSTRSRAPFDFYKLQTSMSRSVSPRSTMDFSIFGSSFEPETGFAALDNSAVGIMAGLRTKFDEALSGVFTLGGQRTKFDSSPGRESSVTSIVGSAGLEHKGVLYDWKLGVRQTVRPAATGTLTERPELYGTVRKALSPRSDFRLSFRGFEQSSVNRTDGDTDDRIMQLGATYRREYIRNWHFEAGYLYTWSDRDEFADTVDRNRLSISVTFNPRRQVQPGR